MWMYQEYTMVGSLLKYLVKLNYFPTNKLFKIFQLIHNYFCAIIMLY